MAKSNAKKMQAAVKAWLDEAKMNGVWGLMGEALEWAEANGYEPDAVVLDCLKAVAAHQLGGTAAIETALEAWERGDTSEAERDAAADREVADDDKDLGPDSGAWGTRK